ncbi:hypothetical protein V8C35DRAFT_307725 [Trichoderma chlorosporum]
MDKPPRTTNTQVREWNEAIKDWTDQTTPSDGCPPQHPAFLWKVCWEKLNVMKIPIVPAESFFKQAIDVAKEEDVTNSTQFMRRFAERLVKVYDAPWGDSFEIVYCHLQSQNFHYELGKAYFPTEDAWRSVYNVCDNPSYVNFLQLLRGITAGWRPDPIQSEENYVPRSCDPPEDDLYHGYNGHDYDSDIAPDEIPRDEVPIQLGERGRKRIKKHMKVNGKWPVTRYDRHVEWGTLHHHTSYDGYHSDMYHPKPKLIWQRTQSKRKKKVHFDGSPDDDNKQGSKRQKLERFTAEPSSSEHIQGERAAKTSDNQMSESHTADPPLSHASSSSTQPIKEERPAKGSKRQRQEPPTADSPSSFTVFSSSENTEERPAKRVRRRLPENDTAGSSLPHASSSHTERVEGKRPAKRAKRHLPENDNTKSSLPHASSSHTERVEGERPAKRIKREMPENDTAGSLLPHASSSRTERVEEEISAGRLEPQGREFATADSSLSPIPSPTRSARGAAKRLRRQKREPATADSSLSAVPSSTAKRLRRRVSQSRTTDSPNTRTSRSNRGAALWQLDRDGEPVEV